LHVFAKVSEMKRSSFIFEYEIVEAQTGRIVADGSTVQACFDPREKRAKPIPDDLRDSILKFEMLEGEPTSK